jgi:alpha-beta hydrolase superfamily lysophospholipase
VSSWRPDGFTVHAVATNATTLSVAVGGSGPTLVLLHGWPQTGRAWQRVMPALARTHTVVVPDLRGTGASDRPQDGYEKGNQAWDIRGVLDALDLPRPAVVAGRTPDPAVITAAPPPIKPVGGPTDAPFGENRAEPRPGRRTLTCGNIQCDECY